MNFKNKIILSLTSLATTSILFVTLNATSQASADEREINKPNNEKHSLDRYQTININTSNTATDDQDNSSISDSQSSNNQSDNHATSSISDSQSPSNQSDNQNNSSISDSQSSNNQSDNHNISSNTDTQSHNTQSDNHNISSNTDTQSSNNQSDNHNISSNTDTQSHNTQSDNHNISSISDSQSSNNQSDNHATSSISDSQSSNTESDNKKETNNEDNYNPTIPKGNQGIVKQNKYPIVLAHGFSGYPDESNPAVLPSYWGGNKVDLDKTLNAQGYDVREGGMSPFGSNYDRALELYYYIKGGTVDYGASHAEKFGHDRYGKTYKGIYPEWEPGKKVHLIGHSFGGQTIQVLEDMLRNGVPEEIDYQKNHGGAIPVIFKGGNDNMVSSVTTIATPHNGTFISDKLGNKPIVRKLFYKILKYTSNKYTKADYGLEHWGIKQRDDESYLQYLKRVRNNRVWKTEDTSFTDGSIEGSKKINDRLTLSKDVAYTSITAEDTHETINNRQRGNFHMFAPFKILANLVGRQDPESWRKGDGPVPLKSGLYPFNKPHKDTTFDSKPELGVWGVMPTLKNWDHMDLVGWDVTDTRITSDMVLNLYEELANYLSEVEKVQEVSE